MRIQTEVITTLGKFVGDLSENVNGKDIDSTKSLFRKCHELDYLSIQSGVSTIYFPAEVIRKSIIILHIIND